MSKFPECFPKNFEKDILPKEAKDERKDVYRIIKNGVINRESFISSYEESLRGWRPPFKSNQLKKPDIYSTSCFMDYEEAKYVLDVTMRTPPKAFISKGITSPECGPCQKTIERKPTILHKSHVDWWIYDDSEPQKYFKEELIR